MEEHNVSRQPFLPEDVGRKKAAVMAEILQEAFQVTCSYYPEYLKHVYELEKFEKEDYVTILIGCVDNHACRKVLHAYFRKSISCFYLDSANEYSVGEVVVGVRIARSEESCQRVNMRQPQHLVTNLLAANLLLKCVVEILSEQEWNGGIYYFDAFKGYSVFREKP